MIRVLHTRERGTLLPPGGVWLRFTLAGEVQTAEGVQVLQERRLAILGQD